MQQKEMQFKLKGMNRDLSESSFNPEFAYSIKNLRLNATSDNTMLSWVNEVGPINLTVENNISGTPIGVTTIDNKIVLFTVDNNKGYIYYGSINSNNEVTLEEFYSAEDLGFDVQHPIEALAMYENENAVKVYWVDGKNQPRMVNLSRDKTKYIDSTKFDFINTLNLKETLTIEKVPTSSGIFAPGVIQYAFTYYNLYGGETNIFKLSSLNYISFSDRGANAEESVGNSFNITIDNIDTSFDYLRIYSIQRTSIDAQPIVKRVVDIPTDSAISEENNYINRLTFTDNGEYGDDVDPTLLLYIGGKRISAGTINQKDNTLFLGNINAEGTLIYKEIDGIEDSIKGLKSSFYFENTSRGFDENNQATNSYYKHKSQLSRPSGEITTFMSGEYYRFGLQFQKSTGEWSEPLLIGDVQNNIIPNTSLSNSGWGISTGQMTIPSDLVSSIKGKGYKKVRPLIVFPSIIDRAIVCQGVMNPTVFNGLDRQKKGSPNVQASWFFRPSPKISTGESPASRASSSEDPSKGKVMISCPYYTLGFVVDSTTLDTSVDETESPRWSWRSGTITIGDTVRNVTVFGSTTVQVVDTNGSASTKQFILLNAGGSYPYPREEAESLLEAIKTSDQPAYLATTGEGAKILAYYFSIYSTTGWLHNRDESASNNNLENSVGSFSYDCTPLYSNISNVTVEIEYTGEGGDESGDIFSDDDYFRSSELEYRHHKSLPPNSKFNCEIQSNSSEQTDYNSNITCTDDMYFVDRKIVTINSPDVDEDFPILNLDSAGTLSIQVVGEIPITTSAANLVLTTKTGPLTIRKKNGQPAHGFQKKSLVKSTSAASAGEIVCVTNNWQDEVFSSVGNNYDISEYSSHEFYWPIYPWHRNGSLNNQTRLGKDETVRHSMLESKKLCNLRFSYRPVYSNRETLGTVDVKSFSSNEITNVRVGEYNYYGNVDRIVAPVKYQTLDGVDYMGYPLSVLNPGGTTKTLAPMSTIFDGEEVCPYADFVSTDPISIKYKSTPHLVAILNTRYPESGLDAVYYSLPLVNVINTTNINDKPNRFGGTTKEAVQSNNWLIGGEDVLLGNSSVTVYWTEGDTYFQRFDCLKTYPFTTEDSNSIIEILSFMCESRTNLDGRYDRNRGQVDNTAMSPINFNKFNKVYNQRNNYFNYRVLDSDLFTFEKYPYSVTWSKTKVNGEKTDTWTNITLASVLDLDGNLGSVEAIRRVNDSLIVFQEKGISQILYNENTQVSTEAGTPIEIVNSGKVKGKRIISANIGCNNKWSICQTPKGLYFVDGLNKAIYTLGENGLINLTDTLGFHTWMRDKTFTDKWNPNTFKGIVSHYDTQNNEVLFTTSDECLAFNEDFNIFTSFYDYNNVPFMINLNGNSYWITNDSNIWLHNGGEYSKFFSEEVKPYHITMIANQEPASDKIFNTVEFRADVLNGNTLVSEEGRLPNKIPFNSIRAWNEYQDTDEVTLTKYWGRPSNIKQKFRIWRVNIPRAMKGEVRSLDRMRNPWIYLTLKGNNTNKTIIHDLLIKYFG